MGQRLPREVCVIEKNGFRSPRQVREAWFAALSKQAA